MVVVVLVMLVEIRVAEVGPSGGQGLHEKEETLTYTIFLQNDESAFVELSESFQRKSSFFLRVFGENSFQQFAECFRRTKQSIWPI